MVEGYVFDAIRQRYFRSRTAADGRPQDEGTRLRTPHRRACCRHPAPASPSLAFLLQQRDCGVLSRSRFGAASLQLVHRSTASWPPYERFLPTSAAAPPSHRPDGFGRWLLDYDMRHGIAVGKGEGWSVVAPDSAALLSGQSQDIERATSADGCVCAVEWCPSANENATLLVVATAGRKCSAGLYREGAQARVAVAELETSSWGGTWHKRSFLVGLALPRAAAVVDMQSPNRQSHWKLPSDAMSVTFTEVRIHATHALPSLTCVRRRGGFFVDCAQARCMLWTCGRPGQRACSRAAALWPSWHASRTRTSWLLEMSSRRWALFCACVPMRYPDSCRCCCGTCATASSRWQRTQPRASRLPRASSGVGSQ